MVFLSFLKFSGTQATPSRLGGCRVSPSGGTLHRTTERPRRPGITQPIQKHTHEPKAPEKPTERPTARTAHTSTQTSPATVEPNPGGYSRLNFTRTRQRYTHGGKPKRRPTPGTVERKKNPGNIAGAVCLIYSFSIIHRKARTEKLK